MPTLTIQFPGLPPVAHVLRDETTTIGRMKGSTIVLDDNSVSLVHAKIARNKEGEYFLKDLNSTNGTLVNGQVCREIKLQNLDQICFADVIAQFHSEAVAPVAPIVPLMPAPAKSPAPAAVPVGGTAPQLIQARPPEAPAKSRRSHSPPGSGFNRLADRALPILGGAAVVVVVSIVVWKLFLTDKSSGLASRDRSPATNTVAASTPPEKKSPTPKPTTPAAPKIQNPGVARLVAGLKDADVEERRRAARALQSMGSEAHEATPALKEALKDADEEVQMLAAFILVNNNTYYKPTIPILVRALRHENSIHRNIACLSLAVFPFETADKDTVVPALAAAAANDDDEEVRKAAYMALSAIAPEVVAKANEK